MENDEGEGRANLLLFRMIKRADVDVQAGDALVLCLDDLNIQKSIHESKSEPRILPKVNNYRGVSQPKASVKNSKAPGLTMPQLFC